VARQSKRPGRLSAQDRDIAELYGEIYAVARQIPAGCVATYGQVAELAGLPGGARTVGRAMKMLPKGLGVPWQRVVGKKSRNTAKVNILDPIGGTVQRKLLEAEGIEFTDADTIRLDRFGWLPTK
jgi:methylated-DNA-protein-cysteine methyltransferase-like protein